MPPEKVERNAELIAAWKNGSTRKELANMFGISEQRVACVILRYKDRETFAIYSALPEKWGGAQLKKLRIKLDLTTGDIASLLSIQKAAVIKVEKVSYPEKYLIRYNILMHDLLKGEWKDDNGLF